MFNAQQPINAFTYITTHVVPVRHARIEGAVARRMFRALGVRLNNVAATVDFEQDSRGLNITAETTGRLLTVNTDFRTNAVEVVSLDFDRWRSSDIVAPPDGPVRLRRGSIDARDRDILIDFDKIDSARFRLEIERRIAKIVGTFHPYMYAAS